MTVLIISPVTFPSRNSNAPCLAYALGPEGFSLCRTPSVASRIFTRELDTDAMIERESEEKEREEG